MKKLISFILLAIVAFFIYSAYTNSTSDLTESNSMNNYHGNDITVEKVELDKSNQYTFRVYGMVRNNGNSPIKGYVKIKYLNSNGDIIGDTKTRVNDGDYINIGQAANFEYYGDPKEFNEVVNFDVNFIEQ